MTKDSRLHDQVLHSLEDLKIQGYEPSIEKRGNRHDLPNPLFVSQQKCDAQRKRSLCYTDAIIHAEHVPRLLIEIVDKNPTRPNGITGLTVNVDRVAEIHPNIDLLFVVLAEMKAFYCRDCKGGHKLSNGAKQTCFTKQFGMCRDDVTFRSLLHEGKPANFKKALIDYPIGDYLKNIAPPTVLFLNVNKVKDEWDAYRDHAIQLVQKEVNHIVSSPPQRETRLVCVCELMPNWAVMPNSAESAR